MSLYGLLVRVETTNPNRSSDWSKRVWSALTSGSDMGMVLLLGLRSPQHAAIDRVLDTSRPPGEFYFLPLQTKNLSDLRSAHVPNKGDGGNRFQKDCQRALASAAG